MIKASNIALLSFHGGYFCVVIAWLICNFRIQMAFLHNGEVGRVLHTQVLSEKKSVQLCRVLFWIM